MTGERDRRRPEISLLLPIALVFSPLLLQETLQAGKNRLLIATSSGNDTCELGSARHGGRSRPGWSRDARANRNGFSNTYMQRVSFKQ